MIERIYIGAVIVLVLLLFYCLYAATLYDNLEREHHDSKMKLIQLNKTNFDGVSRKAGLLELEAELKLYKISPSDPYAFHKLENKIKSKVIPAKKSALKKIINTCFYSIVQGGTTGFITGGIAGSMGGAIVFGTVMPIVAAYRELNPTNESLFNVPEKKLN